MFAARYRYRGRHRAVSTPAPGQSQPLTSGRAKSGFVLAA